MTSMVCKGRLCDFPFASGVINAGIDCRSAWGSLGSGLGLGCAWGAEVRTGGPTLAYSCPLHPLHSCRNC